MFFSVLSIHTVTDCMELFDAGSWITFGTLFLAVAILPVLRGVVSDVQMVTVCTALFGACSWITWATSPLLEVSPAMTIPALPANIASDIAARAILLSRVVFILLVSIARIFDGYLSGATSIDFSAPRASSGYSSFIHGLAARALFRLTISSGVIPLRVATVFSLGDIAGRASSG